MDRVQYASQRENNQQIRVHWVCLCQSSSFQPQSFKLTSRRREVSRYHRNSCDEKAPCTHRRLYLGQYCSKGHNFFWILTALICATHVSWWHSSKCADGAVGLGSPCVSLSRGDACRVQIAKIPQTASNSKIKTWKQTTTMRAICWYLWFEDPTDIG